MSYRMDHDKKMKPPKVKWSSYLVPVVLILFLFVILLWDLKRVKDISDIIHDDHHQLWKQMNSTQLSTWYSMKELCLLEYERNSYHDARTKSLNESRYINNSSRKFMHHEIQEVSDDPNQQHFANITKCVSNRIIQANYNKINPKTFYDKFNSLYPVNVFAKFKCNFGNSIGNRQCLPPYYNRKFYTESLHSSTQDGYVDDAKNQALQRLFLHLDRYKQPLIFLGDVISKQNFDAFICEVYRTFTNEGYHVIVTSNIPAGGSKISNNKGSNPNKLIIDKNKNNENNKNNQIKNAIFNKSNSTLPRGIPHRQNVGPSSGPGSPSDLSKKSNQKNRRLLISATTTHTNTAAKTIITTTKDSNSKATNTANQSRSGYSTSIGGRANPSHDAPQTQRGSSAATSTSASAKLASTADVPASSMLASYTIRAIKRVNAVPVPVSVNDRPSGTKSTTKSYINTNKASASSSASSTTVKTIEYVARVWFFHMTHVVETRQGAAGHDRAYDSDSQYHSETSDSFVDDQHMRRKSVRHRRRQSSATTDTGAAVNATANNINIVDYPKMASAMSLIQAAAQLHFANQSSANGFIAVANVGVWYNTRERFRLEIPLFLRLLNIYGGESGVNMLNSNSSRRNIILFRETAAQHWNLTKTGYFLNGGDPRSGGCQPILDANRVYDWRNRDVRLILERERLHNIHMIPFRDVTAALWSMHPNDRSVPDCTRFCYIPQLWQTVWSKLDQVISSTYTTETVKR